MVSGGLWGSGLPECLSWEALTSGVCKFSVRTQAESECERPGEFTSQPSLKEPSAPHHRASLDHDMIAGFPGANNLRERGGERERGGGKRERERE